MTTEQRKQHSTNQNYEVSLFDDDGSVTALAPRLIKGEGAGVK